VGSNINITLRAALNFSTTVAETGQVSIKTSGGVEAKVTVTETSVDGYDFTGVYAIPASTAFVDVSYGYGFFKKTVRVITG
jgi:hypothetical protein